MLGSHLPTSQYRLIPMYSMSTEAIETIGHFRGSELSFLPTADGVLYEFVDSNPAKAGGELLEPHQLKPGNSYSMIVSDDYGLSRYDTGDVFLCRQKVYDLPDLIFMRRRNLEYSFTGEKLSAEQLCVAFDELRKKADLASDIFVTCSPSQPFSDRIPHYKIVALSEQLNGRGDCFEGLQQDFDRRLAELNCEYKAKRETGRLGPVRLVRMNRIDFI